MLDSSAIHEIEKFIEIQTGNIISNIGQEPFYNCLQTRMSINGVSDYEKYLQMLRTSPIELERLVDLIVIPETYFFRNEQVIKEVAQILKKKYTADENSPMIRILSLACSTGEEPYSIAMALIDLGFTHSSFHIEGVDISRRSISVAKSGVYGENSFRGSNLSFRSIYFRRTTKGYQVENLVKNCVRFFCGNMLDDDVWDSGEQYDAIFCCNVMIYFTDPARLKILGRVKKMLKKDGLFIVGGSEAAFLKGQGFYGAGDTGIFSLSNVRFQQDDNDSNEAKRSLMSDIKIPRIESLDSTKAVFHLQEMSQKNAGNKSCEEEIPQDKWLSYAEKLANEGKLTQSEQYIMRDINAHGYTAEACFLLGVIQAAKKEDDNAIDSFQKALYLDPEHLKSLSYLTLLYEQKNMVSKAKNIRQRVDRVKNKKNIITQ